MDESVAPGRGNASLPAETGMSEATLNILTLTSDQVLEVCRVRRHWNQFMLLPPSKVPLAAVADGTRLKLRLLRVSAVTS